VVFHNLELISGENYTLNENNKTFSDKNKENDDEKQKRAAK